MRFKIYLNNQQLWAWKLEDSLGNILAESRGPGFMESKGCLTQILLVKESKNVPIFEGGEMVKG